MNMVYFEVKRQILTTDPEGPAYRIANPPYSALVTMGGKNLWDFVQIDKKDTGQIIAMNPAIDWALIHIGAHPIINRSGPFVSCTAQDLESFKTLASAKQIMEFYARI